MPSALRLLCCQRLCQWRLCLLHQSLLCGSSVLSLVLSLSCCSSLLACIGGGKLVVHSRNSTWRRFKWLKREERLLRYIKYLFAYVCVSVNVSVQVNACVSVSVHLGVNVGVNYSVCVCVLCASVCSV